MVRIKDLTFRRILKQDRIEVVIFDEELVCEGSKKWELTICGYLVGYKMSFTELSSNEGSQSVIEMGPWMVNGKPMFVQKWDPSVSLDKAEPNKLPLWVKLRNLPLEAWTTKGISAVASRLGTPLIMDQVTTNMCKAGNGRV
nr:hypothetical protein [Tanacetum cinerariifolium]